MPRRPPPFNPPARRAIECPSCKTVRTLAVHPATRLRCPHCRTEFNAPPLGATGTPTTPPPVEATTDHRATSSAPAGGVVGPTVIDVPDVTIAPAPPPPPARMVAHPITPEDIPAPEGSPIPAPAPGQVVEVGPDTVTVDHGGGLFSRHRHTAGRDRRPLRRGDR